MAHDHEPDEFELLDWEDELLRAADPADLPAAPAPSVTLDTTTAAEAMRAAIRTPPPPPDPDAPRPDFVKARPPAVLHELAFPVYDRKAGGYRVINRAFGEREIKYLLKGLLDTFLGTDAAVEPARFLDASEHLHQPATGQPTLAELAVPFRCNRRLHDTRVIAQLVPGTIPSRAMVRALQEITEAVAHCAAEEDYENRHNGVSGFRSGRVLQPREARPWLDQHRGWMYPHATGWLAAFPQSLLDFIVEHDEASMSEDPTELPPLRHSDASVDDRRIF